MIDFRELLESDHITVFDGAMGSMLYSKGVYINRSYDELNLTQPDLVRAVHEEYVRAGAEVIETNTFTATAHKLQQYGLEGRLREINVEGVRLAREAAGGSCYVAGAVGPLGLRIEPYGPASFEEAKNLFRQQAEALLEGGVDLFVLETFSDISEMREAIRAVRELSDLPVVAQMTISLDGNASFGTTPEVFTARLDEWGADVIGLNCGVGPVTVLTAVEKMRLVTTKKLSAQPNAGLPRDVQGRQFYMCSPEYMAKYAKRLIQAGVRFIGGCCGTTPAHIKLISDAVRPLSPRHTGRTGRLATAIQVAESTTHEVPVTPLEERSNWGRRLARGEFLTTVEVLPPKGCDATKTLESIRLLKEAGVGAVNIPDGPRAQTRMSAQATAVLVEREIGLETVLHYCCRDRNLLGMISDLLGAAALGLRNLLVITGDPPKMGPYPDATAVFDIDSIGLTNLVSRLNRGLDPGGNAIGEPTRFVVGVGVNPAAPDLERELRRFAWKVEAGAEFAITQPVFDLDQLDRFLARVESFRVPIVAGIWPLGSLRNAEFLANEVPGISVPDSVLERMRRASSKGKEEALAEGVRISQEMLAAVAERVQGAQVSAPLGRVPVALEVLEAGRIEPAAGQGYNPGS